MLADGGDIILQKVQKREKLLRNKEEIAVNRQTAFGSVLLVFCATLQLVHSGSKNETVPRS